jgi:hypothetical protein
MCTYMYMMYLWSHLFLDRDCPHPSSPLHKWAEGYPSNLHHCVGFNICPVWTTVKTCMYIAYACIYNVCTCTYFVHGCTTSFKQCYGRGISHSVQAGFIQGCTPSEWLGQVGSFPGFPVAFSHFVSDINIQDLTMYWCCTEADIRICTRVLRNSFP